MMIDRRTFIVGTSLAAVAPTSALSLMQLPSAAPTAGEVVLMIDGWSVQSEAGPGDQVWVRIGQGWRAAWR
jgi:hypothetical protein